jgi:hypothetical protein
MVILDLFRLAKVAVSMKNGNFLVVSFGNNQAFFWARIWSKKLFQEINVSFYSLPLAAFERGIFG